MQLDELNARALEIEMRPGWDKVERSLWPNPPENFRPAHWSWADAKSMIEASAGLISADQTDRRNLFMVNPVEDNDYATLRTLVCAYQGIGPGDRAPSHRHTPNALRLVLEGGEGIYTVVDGVRIDMEPGDVVLTPGWSWHGHGDDGSGPGYWIDYLDVPLVHLLEPMFFEPHPEHHQTAERTTRDTPYVFPFVDVARALDEAERDADGGVTDGVVQHVLDAPSLKTLRLTMSRLVDRRTASAPLARTTANQVVSVVEGEGRTLVGDRVFEWRRGDVVAIPRWTWFRHEAVDPAVLFTVSDAPVLEVLGFGRHETKSSEIRESKYGRP